MRKRILLSVAALSVLLALPAAAELATNLAPVFLRHASATALSAADPIGSANNDGGYSLEGSTYLGGATVTKVWCELESGGTAITGGTLRWWRQTSTEDAGWAAAGGLDEIITNTGEKRWASKALGVAGVGTRIYCQPVSVTETGGDGGLTRTYGIRVEKR